MYCIYYIFFVNLHKIYNIMIHFTNEQISEIKDLYDSGKSLKDIGLAYSVSRATIAKILNNEHPNYTGKKRAVKATENQTKVCTKCGRELALEQFNLGNSLFGRRSYCRECEHLIQNTDEKRKRRRELEKAKRQNPEYVKNRNLKDRIRIRENEKSLKLYILRNAKQRAKDKNLEFNLDVSDINIPKICPLLGIPMTINREKTENNSYSLDRIDSTKGYIKGNVWIISKRANVIKNNATLEELELLTSNLRNKLN